ncbi:MAG: restriction endonuclease [Chloroflexi bacterium]|nr:restriction endonuclease [Chloroflexota bacterium]
MSIDVSDQPKTSPTNERRANPIVRFVTETNEGLSEIRWLPVLLYALAGGALMPLSLLAGGIAGFLAGIVPVGVGLMLARSVPRHYGLHGFITGCIGAVIASGLLWILIFQTSLGLTGSAGLTTPGTTPLDAWLTISGFIGFSLIAFSTFGASTAGRIEERNRAVREEVKQRGGALERPGAIRVPDDIRGLSLPQLGTYVNNLFKKKGFTFKDYRFLDKDKYLDIWMEREGEPWRLRLSVADKVAPGAVESLLQEMKREGCNKGVVITSTEFTPGAIKSARDRPIVLIDGATLYQIAEK